MLARRHHGLEKCIAIIDCVRPITDARIASHQIEALVAGLPWEVFVVEPQHRDKRVRQSATAGEIGKGHTAKQWLQLFIDAVEMLLHPDASQCKRHRLGQVCSGGMHLS